MHTRTAFFAALLALPAWGAIHQPVRVAGGQLAGVPATDPAVTVFRGVPFAAPPVGDLRWRAPKAAAPWQGVRKAAEFGANCMQQIVEKKDPWTYEFMAHGATSEDCLYLNVWTGAARSGEKRPVLVYAHGGAFNEGSGSIPAYDGESLAKKGLVVVTVNYRLNVLGFLAHPDLTKESDHHASGNYGLLDLLAALQWVHDNIAAFGGDPATVTFSGQSAGAMAVHALVGSPLAKGLIHRAVAESGALNNVRKLADGEQEGLRFAEAKGAKSIADLRAMPWSQLMARAANAPAIRFSPIGDGWVIVPEATPADIPFLTGSNADENGAVPHPTVLADAYRQGAARRYGELGEKFLQLYPAATDAEAQQMQNASARDQARTTLYLWALKRAGKAKTFTYFYSHPLPGPDVEKYGAFHTSEVPYVFHTLTRSDRPFGDIDRKLADTVSSYWANFARTGDPNGRGLPVWPAVTPDVAMTMELGDAVRAIPVAAKPQLDFLREAAGRPRPAGSF